MSCPRYQRPAEAGEREPWDRNRDAAFRPIHLVVGTYGRSPARSGTIAESTVPTAFAAFDERQAACECASDFAKVRKDSIVLMRHQECSKSAEAA